LAFWNWSIEGSLKDGKFNSSDENEEATTKVWDEPTFEEVQSVFHNWMSHVAWVIKNRGEYIIE
jgi:hypothetical protein